MEHLNDEGSFKMEISFPKSNQDHRLQLIEINGSIFAILHAPLESVGPINLECEKWSLVLLAPIQSSSNISISAKNVICLSKIESEAFINIQASNRLIKFTEFAEPSEKFSQKGEAGEFLFEDDPGALLYFYRLFEGIISAIRAENADLLSQAQQQFITALCTLVDKMDGKSENLNLQQVLNIWGISHLKI